MRLVRSSFAAHLGLIASTDRSTRYRPRHRLWPMRPVRIAVIALCFLLAGTVCAPSAGADPYIEISSHTSVIVTRLGLHAGHGYLTIDARTVDIANSAYVVLPAGGGSWAVTGSRFCSASTAADATVTIGCVIPKAGKYVWTVAVTRTSGPVTGLIGTAGVTYPNPNGPTGPEEDVVRANTFAPVVPPAASSSQIGELTPPALDSFPIIDLDAPPANADAALIAGVTGEVRAVEVYVPSTPGTTGVANLGVTLNVPTTAHPYSAEIQLPIRPGTLWALTSVVPDRAPNWRCFLRPVSATDVYEAIECFSYNSTRGEVPLAAGLHTLILHLRIIGAPFETLTGWVALLPTGTATPVRVDSFPVTPAQ
jgi:hypothetical protein